MARAFKDLNEREVLALAISLEEEDGRIYADFVDGLKQEYPATAELFEQMRLEEANHRNALFDRYRARFGDHIPLIHREDIKGFVKRAPTWKILPRGPEAARKHVELMEWETRRYYDAAAKATTDAQTRQLLSDLADAERRHAHIAKEFDDKHANDGVKQQEEHTQRRVFVLQIVQPALAGLMDGSVSTLAPLFASAFVTHSSRDALVVGLAASVGAGISMGFAEALSDDGTISGRGRPWIRGGICGVMTAIGGLGHTLPYIISDFHWATGIAIVVVCFELLAISWIRAKYMDTPLLSAAFQVIVGGLLVFAAGIAIAKAFPGPVGG